MLRRRLSPTPPLSIIALGLALFVVATATHVRELSTLDGTVGPLIALVVDGVPALGLAYAGYWLSTTDLSDRARRTVLVWCLAGSVAFAAVMTATFLVRVIEGRVVAEPIFPALVAVEAGAIAGLTAGYYNARARRDACWERSVRDALTFVNRLVRHDLRNDLNVIANHAALVAGATDDGSDSGDPEVIVGKADEALAHIETTRITADTLVGDADLESVDLVPVVADLAASTEKTFQVSVTTDLPGRALVTANDGVRSIVDNLLENAVEHADADDLRISVAVDVRVDTVRLRISDTGPGIDPERGRELLRTDDSFDGGLSLVTALVEAYGGDIRIEDTDATGTTVVVDLPRADGSVSR